MAIKFAERYSKDNYKATLIVDALNLAFRWKHTNNHAGFRYEFERTIGSIANSYKSKKIIIAADWGSSSYRKALYPNYKADRQEKYKDQSAEDKIKFEEFFEEYEATLKLLEENYIVLRYRNVEADDIAAHLVKNRVQYELEDIWLLSSDGDWDLLVTEGVNRFSWRSRKEITVNTWSDHYEVPTEQFMSYKCLMGDKSDNIPGITGIGPKRAASILGEYESVFDIVDSIPLPGAYKYIEELNKNKNSY